jgi:hypothetical protein
MQLVTFVKHESKRSVEDQGDIFGSGYMNSGPDPSLHLIEHYAIPRLFIEIRLFMRINEVDLDMAQNSVGFWAGWKVLVDLRLDSKVR